MHPVGIVADGWGWRHATRRAPAVAGLDLRIEPGERVLLLGASGAGKSTLLAAIAGVLGGADEGESSGTLLVDGADPRGAPGRAGLVLQDPDSQTILARVGDDVAFGCENLGVGVDEIWPRVRAALDAVGLDLPLEHATSALSGGQRQRLALAGVLAMRPGILLLDEPTANLDPAGVLEVRDAVIEAVAATGSTLVVVEHRVDTWVDHIDRVVVLEPGGGVMADGEPGAVFAEHGTALAAAGVWVPGRAAPMRRAATRASGTTAAPALSARDLAVARTRGVVVRDGIELDVRRGELTAITGRNGSGKSTLALTLGGLLPPAGGRVDASPIARGLGPDPIRWRSRELLTRIGTVFQEPGHQFIAGSVRAELEIGPRAAGMPEPMMHARIDEFAERLRLDELLGANPFTLSGGQQRRLSVATALVTAPEVLVLDEPTFGQDARTWAELVDLIAGLRDDGRAVVAVTHDLDFVAAIADRIEALP